MLWGFFCYLLSSVVMTTVADPNLQFAIWNVHIVALFHWQWMKFVPCEAVGVGAGSEVTDSWSVCDGQFGSSWTQTSSLPRGFIFNMFSSSSPLITVNINPADSVHPPQEVVPDQCTFLIHDTFTCCWLLIYVFSLRFVHRAAALTFDLYGVRWGGDG